MKNMLAVNRVENELNQWRSREERFSKLFSFSLSSNKALLKEKLEYYEKTSAKYKGTNDLDERFALKVLRQERLQMEKQLYPNVLIRLLRNLFLLPLKEQLTIRADGQNTEQNIRALEMELQKAGFSDLSTELEKQIKQGQQQFSIPVAYYINEKERLDHQLFISKDHTGQYQFEGFKTKLYHEAKMENIREHYFGKNEDTVMDTALAYQLLQGRSIQREDKWLQLDLNDKDAQGNYRIKEFHRVYGFDLEKTLNQLPLKELQDKNAAYKLSEDLKNGIRQAVSFIKDGKEQRYYIEANPQFKSVNIYDQHSRKITLATALGNKTTEAIKLTHKLNEKKVQEQTKRNGIKTP